ncbi:hypothetical protein [Siphonobacter sp. SORGH_AS_1065]|uniref:hypothetical protein n=1 Tax=Siphonobacter sp. SORGH_AS_1065 TaxID=3041795 RepID=UPI002785D6F6|nr:hypothetical protein [Siphonobacter sp. SORGH_AS_1065]MDQ1086148.1 hypothetical protein [Siphonobacter sp. SORGH_AS_1065]
MNDLIQITGNDIALLSDSDLRSLVGLLCEAECRLNNVSPIGVTWGGHQDAKDGGLDVVVLNTALITNGFIPRSNTGFQVKKPNMTASKILEEMKPNGILRESIKQLIVNSGSYIIINSSGSTAATALEDRRKAMRDAVKDELESENLHVDFYDRDRIATWVRCHPSIVLWVFGKLGRSLRGWQPFDNWTRPGEVKEEYLIDSSTRLYDSTENEEENILTIEKGISKLRNLLSTPRSCVRLVGLSGVGKTRFVQTLFDERIGENALNPRQVFYTDISDDPNPDPKSFAEQLMAQNTRAILVIDNCTPELHGRLARLCSSTKSTISLVTIEYDVKDQLIDETETSFFRLEPASDDLICDLIKKRFKHINSLDARTITEASGGNARIAIILASTINKGEKISSLRNGELFERIFQQRNSPNNDLIKSAKAFSLVYSFNGLDTERDSELSFLASIIGKTPELLYEDISELKKRDLIQSRGEWRALLPHAVANYLAIEALDLMPPKKMIDIFFTKGSERLIKSFSKRLSFLHDSYNANQIAVELLKADGLLGDVSNLNGFGFEVFKNIAPVYPEVTLEAIERAVSKTDFIIKYNSYNDHYVRILKSIAFEDKYFIRSVTIICQFVLSENKKNSSYVRRVLHSLFALYLSGTHAKPKTRLLIIHDLVTSLSARKVELGLELLEASLESWHFNAVDSFQFGSRSRDYGYRPKTYEEVQDWFKIFIKEIGDLIIGNQDLSERLKQILAKKFRGLWTRSGAINELEELIYKIKSRNEWVEGWIEVKKTIYHDSEELDTKRRNKLFNLENALRPSTLQEEIKAYVYSVNYYALLHIDRKTRSIEDRLKDMDDMVIQLGIRLSKDESLLELLLPTLLTKNYNNSFYLGKGIAKGAEDLINKWQKITFPLGYLNKDIVYVNLLGGYLNEIAISDMQLANDILDQIIDDSTLMTWFPYFQTLVPLGPIGLERLYKAIDNNISPINLYSNIGYGRYHETITDEDFSKLVLKISSKDNGVEVAIGLLNMRFREDKQNHQNILIEAAREILLKYNFKNQNNYGAIMHDIIKILKVCIDVDIEEGDDFASTLCTNLNNAFQLYDLYTHDFLELLSIIAKRYPFIFLEFFLENSNVNEYRNLDFYDINTGNNVLDVVTDDTIISWCEVNPEIRYTCLFNIFNPFELNKESNELQWRRSVTHVFKKTTDIGNTLDALEENILFSGSFGLYSDKLESLLDFFAKLFNHNNIQVSLWSKKVYQSIQNRIFQNKQWQDKSLKQSSQSFE